MCDWAVRFLVRHDSNQAFLFAPQQSPLAAEVLARHHVPAGPLNSICVLEVHGTLGDAGAAQEKLFTKSEAVLQIAEGLGGLWRIARVLRLLPRSFRDRCYDAVARNRYRISRRRSECRLPNTEQRHRFLT
jgi:predicted DCC family thiol-disulfide oxidoreductase YuxK